MTVKATIIIRRSLHAQVLESPRCRDSRQRLAVLQLLQDYLDGLLELLVHS